LNDRINAFIPAIQAAMQGSGKTFRKVVYPDVDHGFNNDTGSRFNANAAKAAWDETLGWFGKYLS
jgi:carboxymethylenebutenolidase